MWCDHCDPKYYSVYGFCGNCKRRCQPPLLGPLMSVEKYIEFRSKWNSERADLMIDYIRQCQDEFEDPIVP